MCFYDIHDLVYFLFILKNGKYRKTRKLARRLDKSGRASWLDEEMSILTSPETYRLEPDEAWRRLKTRSNDRRYLAVLRSLATWREEEAQQRDVPRGRVLRDEQLFDIAAHRPATEDELSRSRGINRDLARGRIGTAILEAVSRGLELPDSELPKPQPKQHSANGIGPLMDLLKVMLKLRCEEHDVAQKLIANTADLEQIAISDEADVLALRGWRFDIFGRDALALKHGTVALSAAAITSFVAAYHVGVAPAVLFDNVEKFGRKKAAVATFEREPVRAALEMEAHEVRLERLVARVDLCVVATAVVHSGLEICTDPRARVAAARVAQPVRVAKVDGLLPRAVPNL